MSPANDGLPPAASLSYGDGEKGGPSQQPTSEESEVSDAAVAVQETVMGQDRSSKLPFSKARCIVLVATLTGASFLNVRATWRRFACPASPSWSRR